MFRIWKVLVSVIMVGVAVFPLSSFADEALKDDGSHIQINSPNEGDTVSSTFDLHYELHTGTQAHHAHVYLDGAYQKRFKGTFTGVAPGKHEIKVQAADKDHKLLPASATVHVDVK